MSRARILLPAILVLAAVLRVLALDKPLYIDEVVTITVAVQPLDHMGEVMRQIDASPALYPLLLHAWLQLSHADAWARALSALWGFLAVIVVYLLGRRAFGERTGLAAAFVAAIAPAHVHYAQYVRSYSLFTALAGIQLLLVMDWFEARGRAAWRLAALALVTAAMLYTHYLSLLVVAPEGVYALVRLRAGWRRSAGWAAAMATASVLFLPGVPLLAHNMTFDRVRNEARPVAPPLMRLVPDLGAELSVGQRALGFGDATVRRVTLAGAAAVFPVLLTAGVVSGWRENRQRTLLLLLFTVAPVALYLLSGRKLVAVRFFLPYMVGYLVLLGHGLVAMRRGLRVAAGLGLVVVCAIPLAHFYRAYDWSYDHRAVAAAIGARLQPRDVLLFVHPYESFYYRWYLDNRVAMEGLVFTALEDQGTYQIKPPAMTLEGARPRIEASARVHDRFWLIGASRRSFASDPREEERVIHWLDGAFTLVDDLSGLTGADPVVRLYGRMPDASGARAPGRD